MSGLYTLPQIVREERKNHAGLTEQKLNYAAARAGIEETGRIGLVRVFDAEARRKLLDALKDIRPKATPRREDRYAVA